MNNKHGLKYIDPITGKFNIKQYLKQYYLETKEKSISSNSKEYRIKNIKRKKEYDRQRYLKNIEKIREQHKKYNLNNKEKRNEYMREYVKNRKKTDIGFRIQCNLRRRLNLALKGKDKANSTMKLLGCSISYFKIYIESLFKPWMTWENYGDKWSVDHIIPCAAFDLTIPEQQQKCFHYSNLQPLDARENSKKGSMYDNKRYRKTYEKK